MGDHVITAIVDGQQVSGWTSGNFESSMITPADSFVLRIPFNRDLYRGVLLNDSRITIQADGVTMLTGFIDKRKRQAKSGIIEIHGRDRAGRLVDESAPAINYTGMDVIEAIKRLAAPWFPKVTLSNARNRRLRRGKGRRVAAGNEPVVTINVRVPRKGRVHPGETKWSLIHEICSRAGLICYSSADGTELFVGKANRNQPPQYLFQVGAPGSRLSTTVRDLTIDEDWGDRFSLIMCGGVGGQSDTNYGKNISKRTGIVFDNFANRIDGTGRDFRHPKRMYMPERSFDSYGDAQRVAQLEQWRRDYKRHIVTAECARFGQLIGGGELTFFAPDTIGRVVDEEADIDDNYLIVDCSYSFSRDQADVTVMHMVPDVTEIVL